MTLLNRHIAEALPSSPLSPIDVGDNTSVPAYAHFEFDELTNPLLVSTARRIHALGYRAANYVTEEAVVGDELVPELDKARGDNVDYHLAINLHESADMATMRLSGLPNEATSWTDLPLGSFKESFNPEDRARFDADFANGKVFREVGALATTSRPDGLHQIIRKVIQSAYGKDETWLATIVLPAHRSLGLRYGKSNVAIVGKDIKIDDPRVRANLPLKPTLIVPDLFFDNIAQDHDMTRSPMSRQALGKTLLFLTDGFDVSQLSDRVQSKLVELHSGIAA